MAERGILRVLAREWPVAGAALALASLLLIPRAARPPALDEPAEIAAIRLDVESGALDRARKGLDAFLARGPSEPLAAEARFLLGLLEVLSARQGSFPGLAALDRAWANLEEARQRGFDPDRVLGLQREIATLLLERDFAGEAAIRVRELLERSGDRALHLELARALARQAVRERARESVLVGEAARQVSLYMAARGSDPLAGVLARSEISWRLGRFREMLTILDQALPRFPRAEERGRLQLERGSALARIGGRGAPENLSALAALEEAEELLEDGEQRDRAVLLQGALFAREGNPRGDDLLARLIRGGSGAAPAARVVEGRFLLRSNPERGLELLVRGLGEAEGPRALERYGLDFAEIYEAVPEGLRRGDLVERALALYPRSTRYMLDRARLLRAAGSHAAAADQYLAAVETGLPDPGEAERAVRDAAETCFAGALYRRAAELFRRFADLRPEANVDGIYGQAESLLRSGEPGALEAFEAFVAAAPRDPRAARAILRRAEILAELGRPEGAAEEYRRIVGAPDPVVGPDHPDWAEALLGLGRVRAGVPEGRRSLEEYLERYGRDEPWRAGAVEASLLLARAEMAAGEWEKARGRIDAVDAQAGLDSEWVKHARFLRGDLLFAEGKYAEAERAYDGAYRRYLSDEVRLWGLLGRARALARLDRTREARRDFERGRDLFEQNRSRYEGSFEGFGRGYWAMALAQAGRELR